MYKVTINEKDYDLPKPTLKLQEEVEKVAKINLDSKLNVKTRLTAMFNFIKTYIFEKDVILEIFESDNINQVDTILVNTSFVRICNAYEKALREVQSEVNMQDLEELTNRIDLEKLYKIVELKNNA